MPTINPIFDGSTPVERAPGQGDAVWDVANGFLGYYSAYDATPGANLTANASLTGSNWRVAAMRFGADGDNTTNITDSASGSGRRIDYLKLGQNSDVDLVSTRVKYIEGGDGAKHDIQLGSEFTNSVNIGADLNVVKTGSGYLGNLEVWNGRGIVTVNGNAGAISLGNLKDRVIIDGGDAKSVSFRGGEDRLILKDGAFLENSNATSGDFIARLEDGSRVASLRVENGDADIEVKDTSKIFALKLDRGTNTVTTEDGFLESFYSYQSNNTVTLGTAGSTAGGAGQLQFSSGTGQTFSHTIVSHGWLGSLNTEDTGSDATDDQTTDVTVNWYAGSLLLGSGDDTVKTGDFEVEYISTGKGADTVTVGTGGSNTVRTGGGNDTVDTSGYVLAVHTSDGNDTVKIGTGGAGLVRMGDGNDTILVSETDPTYGLNIRGGSGTDEIDFNNFNSGVTFTLDGAGIFQNVTAPGGDLLTPADGYFSETSIENLSGTAKGDRLTGDDGKNVLEGRGGHDRLFGGAQKDTLRGDAGKDKLFGEKGNDYLFGGEGRDVLEGGQGNDSLRGNTGRDVFVFGKNSGTDKVKDFKDGKDMLRLEDHTGGFNDLTLADVGGDLRIDHDNGTILLVGEAGTVLTAADFDFV